MQYKTIVLELLQEHTTLHERLRENRLLLKAVETCSMHLKARHEFWTTRLHLSRMTKEPSQISSSALEMAVQEFRDDLPPVTTEDANSLPNVDAMAFIRRYAATH